MKWFLRIFLVLLLLLVILVFSMDQIATSYQPISTIDQQITVVGEGRQHLLPEKTLHPHPHPTTATLYDTLRQEYAAFETSHRTT